MADFADFDSARQFYRWLTLIIHTATQCYVGVTKQVPIDNHDIAWEEYSEQFNRKFLVPVLETLEQNNCSVAELCLLTLKLVEIAGRSAQMAEGASKEEQNGDNILKWHINTKKLLEQ